MKSKRSLKEKSGTQKAAKRFSALAVFAKTMMFFCPSLSP
jgi:hypothetical protein